MIPARYAYEPDFDRKSAGWGEHFWVVDRSQSGLDRLLRMLPKREAAATAAQLNASEFRKWFAWRPVWCEDGTPAWGRSVWARREFLGGVNSQRAAAASPDDIMVWRYYRSRT